MTLSSKWVNREKAIRQMVAEGMTDAEIGEVYGVGKGAIADVRKALGILRQHPAVTTRSPATESERPPGETYVDENGLVVTRYPERYADGVDPRVTARGRG